MPWTEKSKSSFTKAGAIALWKTIFCAKVSIMWKKTSMHYIIMAKSNTINCVQNKEWPLFLLLSLEKLLKPLRPVVEITQTK